MTIVENSMENPSFFRMDFEGSYEVLLRHIYFWSTHFWQWNNCLLKILGNLHRDTFSFFIFSKWKKYYNHTFDDMFKMCCCTLCSPKFKLQKQAVFKSRTVEYAIVFFDFLFMFILTRLFSKKKKKKEKLSFFNTNFQNKFQDVVYYKILGCRALSY